MYYRYIQLKLKSISLSRWVLLTSFFFIISYFDIQNMSRVDNYSLVEWVIIELNDFFNICYYFLFAIIIISSDIFTCSKEAYYNQIYIKLGTRKNYIKANVLYIVVLSIIIIILFIMVIFIVYLVFFKEFFISHSLTMKYLGLPYLTWLSGLLLSVSLLLCRLVFLNSAIFLINIKLNYPVGFIFAFFITILDWWLYETFQIMEPLYILPIEHTRIFYTEAVAPASGAVFRISYSISYIYWIILIGIEIYIIWRTISKKDFITREYIN